MASDGREAGEVPAIEGAGSEPEEGVQVVGGRSQRPGVQPGWMGCGKPPIRILSVTSHFPVYVVAV